MLSSAMIFGNNNLMLTLTDQYKCLNIYLHINLQYKYFLTSICRPLYAGYQCQKITS